MQSEGRQIWVWEWWVVKLTFNIVQFIELCNVVSRCFQCDFGKIFVCLEPLVVVLTCYYVCIIGKMSRTKTQKGGGKQ